MSNWLPAAILSLFSFGLWGFFSKLAVGHIDAKSALIYQTLGAAVVGIIILITMDNKLLTNVKGLSYGLLTGFALGVGCWCYFIAASKGKIITVVTFTSLYPLITILLGLCLLKETINPKQCLGVLFALVAIVLMSA